MSEAQIAPVHVYIYLYKLANHHSHVALMKNNICMSSVEVRTVLAQSA